MCECIGLTERIENWFRIRENLVFLMILQQMMENKRTVIKSTSLTDKHIYGIFFRWFFFPWLNECLRIVIRTNKISKRWKPKKKETEKKTWNEHYLQFYGFGFINYRHIGCLHGEPSLDFLDFIWYSLVYMSMWLFDLGSVQICFCYTLWMQDGNNNDQSDKIQSTIM